MHADSAISYLHMVVFLGSFLAHCQCDKQAVITWYLTSRLLVYFVDGANLCSRSLAQLDSRQQRCPCLINSSYASQLSSKYVSGDFANVGRRRCWFYSYVCVKVKHQLTEFHPHIPMLLLLVNILGSSYT